jgi:asparagine synthase (glutamine-hydrolysing)
MSAIFGYINKNGKPADEQSIQKMLQAISHRATDGSATWVDQNAAMGNCLLIVHPQQNFEQQPLRMGNLVITSDARLDNRSELASFFSLDKPELQITPDSKLLLLAYQKWGNKCVDHLEGEYAFAIWDIQNQELFVATDHIGFRPFFYYDSPDLFIFCSEIKGVVAVKPLPNYFEEESLIEYFYRKGSPNKTYNKEVFALCGGNTLVLKDGKIDIRKYWKLESTGKYHFKKDQEWYDCTRDLIYKAVEKRLNPDVPVGLNLSGGLDSTSIACILSELLMKKNKPLYAFSSVLPVDYKGFEKDERRYVEIVGKHCPNIIQTYVEAPEVGPFSDLRRAFDIEECFPYPLFYMNDALLQEANQKNIRIHFSGFGGDYWVSWKGSSVIYELIRESSYRKAFFLMCQFCKTDKQPLYKVFANKYIAHANIYKRLRAIAGKQNGRIAWQESTALQDSLREKYTSSIWENNSTCHKEKNQQLVNDGNIGRKMNRFYNRDATHEMESAVPLFDKDVYEYLCDLPIHLFIKGGNTRSLIKNAMKDFVPPEINTRIDKLPFSPDYIMRVIKEKDAIVHIINTSEHNFIFNQYMKKEVITNYLRDVELLAGILPSSEIINNRTPQAVIVYYALKYIKENNYVFL